MSRVTAIYSGALQAPCLLVALQCGSLASVDTSLQSSLEMGSRCFHSSSLNFKPKIAAREELPEGWHYTGSQKASTASYHRQMKEYRQKVGILRTAWQPLVLEHKAEVCAEPGARTYARTHACHQMSWAVRRVPCRMGRTTALLGSNT